MKLGGIELGVLLNSSEANRKTQKKIQKIKRALLDEVKSTTADAKEKLRAMTRAAFSSQRLPNSWQSKIYGPNSWKVAGFVFTKAPVIMRAFSQDRVITAKNKRFLAVPTEWAPKEGVNGKRISPSNFPTHQYGPLRFVYRHRGPSFLVVDNVRASYKKKTKELRGFKPASARQKAKGKAETVIMFFLYPRASLAQRIDPDSVVKGVMSGFPTRVTKAIGSGE